MANRLMIAAIVLCGGFAMTLLANPQRRVSAPIYKVEKFEVKNLQANNSQQFERKLNELAAQGWEYVGPLTRASFVFVTSAEERGQKDVIWIAFKRNED